MKELRGKVAVITGAASGIGAAIARECADRGMRVVLADLDDAGIDQLAAELGAKGAAAMAVPTDVTSKASVEALASTTVEHFGGAHLLCNNAGIGGGGLSWETSRREWNDVMDVDFWGVLNGIEAFVPLMIRQDEPAHVVNTSSMAGVVTGAGMAAYRTAKFAVVALSETLFHDLDVVGAPIGVTVLCPGWVNTSIGLNAAEPGQRSAASARIDAALESVVLSEGIDAVVVASSVLDAVVAGQLYLFTHPQWSKAITRRAENMVAGVNPRLDPIGTAVKSSLAADGIHSVPE
ncbi:MAG: SDR family NAD(P)-dependent oxidoreductase [Acidimicrobiia bacterium]|nr:SDR family NAD(P)-dependent oxidoreductase [Acidimicrobiia bacterium]